MDSFYEFYRKVNEIFTVRKESFLSKETLTREQETYFKIGIEECRELTHKIINESELSFEHFPNIEALCEEHLDRLGQIAKTVR